MKNVFIDLETTGLNAYKNGVHQIAVLYEDTALQGTEDGIYCDGLVIRCQPFPEDEIVDKALEVGGVTREDLEGFMLPEEAFAQFTAFLCKYINSFNKADKAFFYAYNAKFVEEFLRAWFTKNKNRYFGSCFWTPIEDVMGLVGEKLKPVRHQMKDFKQGTVARQIGLEVDEEALHDAMYDVHLARQIYQWVCAQNGV
jgi:DNA polymerase III subunit epsilon